MAVNEYTYGTVAGTHDKCGWVIPGRAAFGAGTVPTETEVENILDTVCSQIHAKLAEAGYTVDTKANVTTNAPRAVKWLERLNECGAAAEIIMTFAIAGDPERDLDPSGYWRKVFENGLKMISGRFLSDLGMSKSRQLSDHLVATWVEDEDGNEKDSKFQMDMWTVPGSQAGIFPNEDIGYGE